MFEPSCMKEERCEECGHKDVLFDAIIDGQLKRICQRCITTNPVIVIKKPPSVKEEDVPRRSVHEILEEMSGIKPKPIEKPTSQVTLEDLRKRYEEIKERRRLLKEQKEREEKIKKVAKEEKVLDEKEFIKHLEKEREEKRGESEEEKIFDFSIPATKHTRIRDLLRRMKKVPEEEKEGSREEEKI